MRSFVEIIRALGLAAVLAACTSSPPPQPDVPQPQPTARVLDEPTPSLALEDATDPRCTRPLRSVRALATQLEEDESTLQKMSESDPGRPQLVFKLARAYGELSCRVRSNVREQAANVSLELHFRAQANVGKHYRTLKSKYPEYCWDRSDAVFPEASCADESTFFMAYALVQADDFNGAEGLLETLLRRGKNAPYTPYAYALFGDHSLEKASELFPETFKLSANWFEDALDVNDKLEPELLAFLLVHLGLAQHMGGNEGAANITVFRLAGLAQQSPTGLSAIALRKLMAKKQIDYKAKIESIEKDCMDSVRGACSSLQSVLAWKHAPASDKERMARLYVKLCESNNAIGCINAAIGATDPTRAIAYLEKGCQLGDAESCGIIGTYYAAGKSVAVNEKQAAEYFIRACDKKGHVRFCVAAAEHLARGVEVAKDEMRAYQLVTDACQPKQESACVLLGDLYRDGRYVTKDVNQARTFYSTACAGTNPMGCIRLGQLAEQDKDAKLRADAYRHYDSACRSRDAEGCYRLGRLLLDSRGRGDTNAQQQRQTVLLGLGITSDEAAAATLFNKACDFGSGEGCFQYAQMLVNGTGIEKNETRAVLFHSAACDNGHARGCYESGRSFPKSKNADKAAVAAGATYTKSCTSGDAPSCVQLGLMHGTGFGVKLDPARSFELLNAACDKGDASGCYHAARAFMNVQHSQLSGDARSSVLLEKSCNLGNMHGCFHRSSYLLVVLFDTRAVKPIIVDTRVGTLGIGLRREPVRAAQLLGQACDAGVARSCNVLGTLLELGDDGISKDPAQAKARQERACTLGVLSGCEAVKKL